LTVLMCYLLLLLFLVFHYCIFAYLTQKKWELFQLSGSLSSNKIENVYSKYHWFFTKTAEKNRSKQIIMKEFGASGMYEAGYACSSIVQLCIVDAGIEPCCIAFCSVNRGSCFVIILYISPVFKSL